ncbi:MAG: hypothetical protein VYA30_05545 [Myxococcota bacterium]|nr:hypothetical protein [Myxococcota bacterium]
MMPSALVAFFLWIGMPLKQTEPTLYKSHWAVLEKLHNYVDSKKTAHAHDLTGMGRRARSSAWIPTVGATYRFVQDDWNRTTVEDSQRLTDLSVDNSIRFGRRYQVGFEVSWKLSDLLYHPDELRIADSARRFDAKRKAQKAALTEAYINWIKASPTRVITPTIESLRAAQQKRLHWALILNSLTGGEFSKMGKQTFGYGVSK